MYCPDNKGSRKSVGGCNPTVHRRQRAAHCGTNSSKAGHQTGVGRLKDGIHKTTNDRRRKDEVGSQDGDTG